MENEIRPGFSRRGFLLLLTLALAGRCLCMALMPIVDPSEARYAVMGRNMALSGNFMEPRFVHGGELQVFEGKPPLFFQSSGWCCRLFGVSEFSVRLPALVSGILILLCLYFCCRKLRDESTARLAVLICGATPVFYLFSGLCMTDLMLAASISIAVMGYMLFSAAEDAGGRRTGSLLFFASLGVGMMIKGPVAIVLAGLPVFLFVLINKRWKDLKHHSWICGTALFLLIALPWYWMMACRNPDFLEYFFINENFKRFLFKEYGDRYGSGRESFRGMAVFFMLLDTAPFIFAGLYAAFRRRKELIKARYSLLSDPLVGLAFLCLASNTLFWCLTSRLLLTYLLPVIPMSSILLAEFIRRREPEKREKWSRGIFLTSALLIALSVLVMLFVAFLGDHVTANIAGNTLKKAMKLEEYADTPCYFVRHTPYSAEFYLGSRVSNHPKERREKSLERSGECLFFLPVSDLRKFEQSPGSLSGRRELFSCGVWHVFSPKESSPGKNKP